MRRADARMPGEGDFLLRGENPHAVVGTRRGRRQHERRFREIGPARDCLHLVRVEVGGLEDDGERIAGARARREDIDLLEGTRTSAHHASVPRMTVWVWPPIQMPPLSSTSTSTRPSRPISRPWLAT